MWLVEQRDEISFSRIMGQYGREERRDEMRGRYSDEMDGKDSFGRDKRIEERERPVDRGEKDRGGRDRHGHSSRGRDDDRRKRDNDNEWDRRRDIYRDRERQTGGNNEVDYNRGTYRSREDRYHGEGRGGAFRRQVDPERRASRLRERERLPYVSMWARSPSPPPVKKFAIKTRPEKNVEGRDNKSKKSKARERSPSKSSSYSSSSIVSSSSSSSGSGSDTDNDGSDGSSESGPSSSGDEKRKKRYKTEM